MKKRLALVLSIVLALSVAICLLVLPTSADPAEGYFNAEAEADTVWASAANKVYTVYYNGKPLHNTKAETSLADLNIGFTGGTYTLDNGVLTLNNAEVEDPSLRFTANGSLKMIINGKDLYAAVENDFSPYGDLLITSDTGNKIITGVSNNAIRSSGNLIVYGNVGFEVVHASGDDQIVIDDYGPDASVRMILAPEVDSIVSGYGGRTIRHSRAGDVYLGGSANVTIANGYSSGNNFLTDGGSIRFVGTGSWDVSNGGSNVQNTESSGVNTFSAYEDVTVSVNTAGAPAFNPSYTPNAHFYGNSNVTIVTQSNVLGGNTTVIDGNATVSLTGSTSVTYGGVLTIGGSADVTLKTTDASGMGAVYDAKTTISDDAEVNVITAGNAIRDNKHNDTGGLVLSDNAKLTVNAGIYAFNQTPVTASGNVQINVVGQDRAFTTDSPLTLSDNVTLTASANGTYAFDASPVTATGNVKISVTATHHVFHQSAVSLSGTSTLDATANEFIFLYSNVSLGGSSKTTAVGVTAPTYGSGGYTFDVYENAKLSIETAGGDVLYSYSATFRDNAQVSLKAGNGSVCWNSSVDILGNAVVDMHTDGFSGSMIHGGGGQSLFVEDNATLNISGVTGNVVSMNYGRSDRNYIGFSMSDTAKVNVNVTASHVFCMNEYAGINVSGGKLDVRGTISYSVFNSRATSNVNITGGSVFMNVPDARAFFEAANADTYFNIGAGAKVYGTAKQLFCAFGEAASYLNFEPITAGSPNNIMLIGNNGTSCVGYESYSGHFLTTTLNPSAGVPRLFSNYNGRDTSAEVVARVTDANGTTDVTAATPYNTEYGSLSYDATTGALYASNLNIIKLETFVSTNLILSGENKIINSDARALTTAGGKSMTIWGPDDASLTLSSTNQTIFVDKLTTLGGFTLNATSTSGCVMETGGDGSGIVYGDYLFANKTLNVTSAGNYALCTWWGSGDLSFRDCNVTVNGASSLIRNENGGSIYIDYSTMTATGTGNWVIVSDQGNININASTVTATAPSSEAIIARVGSVNIINGSVVNASSTGSYRGIHAAGSVLIRDSEVTATGASSNGISAGGSLTVEDSTLTATASVEAINVTGAISFVNSTVTATGTTSGNALTLKSPATVTISEGSDVTVSAPNGDYAVHIDGLITVDASRLTAIGLKGNAIRAKGGFIATNGSTVSATSTDGANAVNVTGNLTLSNTALTVNGASYTVVVSENLRIDGGSAVEIASDGGDALIAVECVVADSTVTATAGGSEALYLSGALTVTNSTVTATAEEEKAIKASSLTVSDNSKVTASAGSQVATVIGGNVTVSDSEFSSSTAGQQGVYVSGNLVITDSVFSGISTGSYYGIYAANVSATRSQVTAQGGSSNALTTPGKLVLRNSSLTASAPGSVVNVTGEILFLDSTVEATATGGAKAIAAANLTLSNSDLTAAGGSSTICVTQNVTIEKGSFVDVSSTGDYATEINGTIIVDASEVAAYASGGTALRKYGSNSGDVIICNGSVVTANSEGRYGLVVDSGDLYITDSTVTATAAGSYGAISAGFENGGDTPRNIHIKNSTVTATAGGVYGNTVGALYASGEITVEGSDITVSGAHKTVNALAGPIDVVSSKLDVTGTYQVLSLASVDNSTVSVTATGAVPVTESDDDGKALALTAEDLPITNGSSVTVTAAAKNAMVVSGALDIDNSSLTVSTDGESALKAVTLSVANGSDVNVSAATQMATVISGTVKISDSEFYSETAGQQGFFTHANLTITDSEFTAISTGSYYGLYAANVTAERSTVTARGGSSNALTTPGELTLKESTLTVNCNGGDAVNVTGNISMKDSTVNVTAGGGYSFDSETGNITVDDSVVTLNVGGSEGGITAKNGTITIQGSKTTVTSNSGYYALLTKALVIKDHAKVYASTTGSLAVRADNSISVTNGAYVEVTGGTHSAFGTDGNITIDSATVKVTGENNVIKTAASIAISNAAVTATGTTSGNALALCAAGTLSVTNGSNVTVSAPNGDYAVEATGLLTVDNSSLTATAAKGNSIRAKAGANIEDGSSVTVTAASGAAMNITGNLKVDNSALDVTGGGSDVVAASGKIDILNNSDVSVVSEGSYPIYSYDNFTIDSSSVTAVSNTAHRALTMFNSGTLTINKSYVDVQSTYFGITTDNGNIVITDSTVNARTQDQGAIFAGVSGSTGSLTITDSKVTASTNGYYAIRTAQDLVINGSDVTATTGTSYTVTSIGGSISATDSKVTVNCGTSPAIETTNGSVTFTHSDVTSTAGTFVASNNANIKVNNGTLTVNGGTVCVGSTFTTYSVAEGDDPKNYYGAGIMVNNGALNVTAGDLIIQTSGESGAVGTSVLLNYSTLNVGGGEKKAGLAVYHKGSFGGYAGGSAAAITMYPGTVNVMDNGSVYVNHDSYIGIYALTREGMAETWNTDAGLRVSGGQVEVYSSAGCIPFGQGRGTNGGDKTTFSANYKYTGGVVLAHTGYNGYVYDTTFQSNAVVQDAFFVGSVGRTLTGGSVNMNLGEHDSFDRAGDLPSQDWIYWANGAEYQYYNPINQGNGVLVSYDGESKWAFKAPVMTTVDVPYGQYFINSDVYELKKDQTVTLESNPVIILTSGQTAYASFDVQWAAMNFVYVSGAWVPSTHTYESEGWVHKTGDQVTDATVKVTNRGTTVIETSLTYTPYSGYESFAVSIDKSGEEEISVGGEIVYTVDLNANKPSEEMDSVAVGTLKLTVVMPGAAAIPVTPEAPVVPNDPTSPGTPDTPGTPVMPNVPEDQDPSEEEPVVLPNYDSNVSHDFFATNVQSGHKSIQLYSANADGSVTLKWSWNPDTDYPGSFNSSWKRAFTAAKLRVHPTYGNVLVICSEDGWVGVIKYGAEGAYADKQLIFDAHLGNDGPHDVEMLPNGDFVVLSTASKLFYFNFSTSTAQSPIYTLTLKNVSSENSDGHGVMWDPTLDCLWVLHDYYIAKIIVDNYGTSNVSLHYDAELHFTQPDSEGVPRYVEAAAHGFAPALGQPGKYYFTGHYNTWIFDSKSMTFEKADAVYQCGDNGNNCGTASSSEGKVKGVVYFEDGTVVLLPMAYGDNDYNWSCGGMHVVTWDNGVATHHKITVANGDFYKVFPATASYQ